MKRLISLLFIIAFIVTSTSGVLAAEQEVKIIINGKEQTYSQPPVVINGSTLVPLRGIFETLGAKVTWEGATKTVFAQKDSTTIILIIGSNIAKINDQTVQLAQAARVMNGSTMVPLRFVSEALGAKVAWDGKTRTVTITQDTNAMLKELNNQIVDAIIKHDANTVKSLLEKGAYPNYLGEWGTPLMTAVRYGTTEIVKILIDGKADVLKQDPKGWTALMHAANENKIEMAQILLDSGAKLEVQDSQGVTSLMYAADKGHAEMVRFLLDAGANHNVIDYDGWNALMYGVIANSVEVTRDLLEVGSNPNQADKGEFEAVSPLMKAAENGNTDIIQLLIDAGATVNQTDIHGWTPLYYAVTEGHLEAVQALIHNQASINISDFNKVTPLMFAIDNQFFDITKFLLESGASIYSLDVDNWTPIIFAAYSGNPNIINLLIEKGANVQDTDNVGATTLMYAAESGNVDAVNLFINRGVSSRKQDKYGWNALHYAANNGKLEVIQLLIGQGLSIESQDTVGSTPLMLASYNGHIDVINYLIQRGASIHKKDFDGWNSLFYAVHGKQGEIVRDYVQKGINPNEVENDGATALMYAANNQDEAMVSLLLSLGADPNILDNNGWSALMSAAYQDQVEIAQLLLISDANINEQNGYGDTPLIIAAENGYTDFVELLLVKGVNLRLYEQGEKAKYYAGQNGFREVVELLEQAQSTYKSSYKIESNTTNTGYIHLQGTTYPGVKWVLVEVKKNDTSLYNTTIMEVENNQVQGEIFLPYGNGEYTLTIYESEEADKNTREYYQSTSFNVASSFSSGYNLSAPSTDNSMVRIEGIVDTKYKWVWFIIKNEDKFISKNVVVQPVDGRISETIYLNLGTGNYTISVYESEEAEKYNEQYFLNKVLRVTNTDTTSFYLLPSEMVESENPQIIALAESITRGLTTDMEKSKAIHDWVVKNIHYDTSVINGEDVAHSALETLELQLTDCDGYARLTAALHRAVGIKAKIVAGATIDRSSGEVWSVNPEVDHAWNEVYIDGKWIIIDTTWDAGYIENQNFVSSFSEKYFNPTKSTFDLDHKKIEELVE